MTQPNGLRAIPTEDRAWLIAALQDALAGGAPVFPLAPDTSPEVVLALQHTPLPEGTALVVRTSGSSGIPKAVALSAAALRASANATHEAFGGPGQWLVPLPSNLISGIQPLIRSAIAEQEPVFVDGAFDPARLLAAAELMTAERRYVSLVPVQLSRLLDHAAADPEAAAILQRFDAVLVGGQAITVALRQRCHELGVALKRSYGMTETAGGCVYDGVEIGDTLVRIRAGEVQLAGSALALGYVGDPELTADRFITETDSAGTETRWYRTGDAGELLGGMLTVTGRIDRVLISGGINVSLDEVERVVREQPGWASAVALAAPHPEWGERVTLVLETSDQAQSDAGADAAHASFERVREEVRARLGVAALPEWVTETPEIPRLAGGKPDLIALGEWLGRLRDSFRETRRAPKHAAPDAGADVTDAVGTADTADAADAVEAADAIEATDVVGVPGHTGDQAHRAAGEEQA
ncbi:AMP-binding protein [Leucobacter luti]|uniref:AMP-binding protein n=1 Tax=Leucobacter luti TaxID=340320 RepID=UPI001C693027|nr:AMP-binding protein [Leucobacter luti]QYM75132.1 AMP-binding protein [Leucobacter luti]